MENQSEFYKHLEKLISFRSVKSAPADGKPFGEGVYSAYSYFMSLAESLGFKTINYDNYIGEVIYGEGQEIGIIGHLDVVPEGTGWNTNPYVLTKIGNKYYGRGLLDDKTPLLACLFVLNELKNSKILCNKKFRLIVGCDEESGWGDVDYFLTKSYFPEYGFSPDGDFPVSYAEKGINKIIFTLPKLKNFYDVKGGTVFNAVCGLATCKAKKEGINLTLLKKYGLTLDGDTIKSVGKSCHGSQPHLGKNAIKPLFEYFCEMGEDLKNAVDYLFNDKGGLNDVVTPQGKVTFSPNIIEEKDDKIVLYCDCRVPAPKLLSDLIPIFDSFGIKYTAIKKRDPLYVPKDGTFVQTLLNSFNRVANRNDEPISQCGATFASVFKRGCAFGPEIPGKPGSIHEPNENVLETDVELMYNVYKDAIFALAQSQDFN